MRTQFAAACLIGLSLPSLAALPTVAQVLERSPATDWRALDPQNTLVMDLAAGQVLIELGPALCAAARGQTSAPWRAKAIGMAWRSCGCRTTT